nr:hypothetical protein [Halobacillus sp. KGW1]
MVELTLSHWIYGLFTFLIIVTMIFRKGVVLPTLLGTFLVAWVFHGSIVSGFIGVFQANLVAARELFNIFLIITFMVALLRSLRDLGADTKMIQPIEKVMVNSHLSFFVLLTVTYIVSLFFWPTPAVPLICALLVPAAIRTGLPAMTAAVVVAIAGQGMALSSDYIIQVAPGLSAKSAGVETAAVMDQAMILSLITGAVAISLVYLLHRKSFRTKGDPENSRELAAMQGTDDINGTDAHPFFSRLFAILVPLAMLAIMIYMVTTKVTSGGMGGFEGGTGAAFIGGVAVLLLLLSATAHGKLRALDDVSKHLTEGFVFAFRAMGPVIPIAGFFFLGSADFAKDILVLSADSAPSLLFDLVQSIQQFLPESAVWTAFSILLIGIITGLDGSGFSGLPLTGALSASLANGQIDVETLAAIGQMGSIWTGGGTIIAWSSLIAIAGFCGVPVMELVRKNFFPVLLGLIASTTLAIFLF